VAAQVARRTMGVNKVLIVDWDVHHGNGTQHMFEEDPNVLYFSIHRHDAGTFYPQTGSAKEVGIDKGIGRTVNMPWNFAVMGDAEYISAFERVLLPIAKEFKPDLVLVSSGFDCAKGDPIGGMEVTPLGFAKMTELVCQIANGKVVVALEGGYNLRVIAQSAASVVRVLLGDKAQNIPDTTPHEFAQAQIDEVIKVQQKYWACFEGVKLREVSPEIMKYYEILVQHVKGTPAFAQEMSPDDMETDSISSNEMENTSKLNDNNNNNDDEDSDSSTTSKETNEMQE